MKTHDAATPIDPTAQLIGIAEKKILEMKERHRSELDMLYRVIALLEKVPADVAEKGNPYAAQLDFDNLTREESLEVMKALGAGKWEKSVNSSQAHLIDYVGKVDGITVRLWAAAPPDSCRVIEVEEVIPATVIKHRKLVCYEEPI